MILGFCRDIQMVGSKFLHPSYAARINKKTCCNFCVLKAFSWAVKVLVQCPHLSDALSVPQENFCLAPFQLEDVQWEGFDMANHEENLSHLIKNQDKPAEFMISSAFIYRTWKPTMTHQDISPATIICKPISNVNDWHHFGYLANSVGSVIALKLQGGICKLMSKRRWATVAVEVDQGGLVLNCKRWLKR